MSAVGPLFAALCFLAGGDRLIAADSAAELVKQGSALLEKGQFDEAITTLTKALAIDGRNVAAPGRRGLAYVNKGEWDKAIADLDAAIALDASQPAPYFNRAFAYFRQAKYEKAIADYNEAIRLDPKYADAFRDRGFARAMSGKAREGLLDLDRALDLNPQDRRPTTAAARPTTPGRMGHGHRRLRPGHEPIPRTSTLGPTAATRRR